MTNMEFFFRTLITTRVMILFVLFLLRCKGNAQKEHGKCHGQTVAKLGTVPSDRQYPKPHTKKSCKSRTVYRLTNFWGPKWPRLLRPREGYACYFKKVLEIVIRTLNILKTCYCKNKAYKNIQQWPQLFEKCAAKSVILGRYNHKKNFAMSWRDCKVNN